MPFTRGHKLSVGNKGGGRKGYEFEKGELDKMREILNKDLNLVEKLQDKSLSKKEMNILKLTQTRVLKIMDKLHASKQAVKEEIEHSVSDPVERSQEWEAALLKVYGPKKTEE